MFGTDDQSFQFNRRVDCRILRTDLRHFSAGDESRGCVLVQGRTARSEGRGVHTCARQLHCYNGQIAHGQVIVADGHDHDIHHNCSTLDTMGSPLLDK
jgi:hypothetical protein